MLIHANTTAEDFLKFLYHKARELNAPQQVIDVIDHIRTVDDVETVLAAVTEEKQEARKDAGDLYEELAILVDAVGDERDISLYLADALEVARQALERHKAYK